MSDKLHPSSIDYLLKAILQEKFLKKEIFGIPLLFFNDEPLKPALTKVFNRNLEVPLGVAAGPHTQLSQNIVTAWLCGARYIELKTVQTLDELELPKPCIDMQDEGYNCEWSQELKIEQTFHQYLDAWILIHVLNYELNKSKSLTGTIFNMSVGYDYKGILNENVQWFFNKMKHCPNELQEKRERLKSIYPKIEDIIIPASLSDNITLSTMHGCPPNEVEKIANYLMVEQGLHTYVKLNPTLLGPTELRKILNDTGNFDTIVPDEAFEHDIKWADAVDMIKRLNKVAFEREVEFGLKLTNTLESKNHKQAFPDGVEMMYMSGRALHPIAVSLANKLQNQFNGRLNLSFSGGADAFNFPDLIAAGFKTVTVSTDLLKPGGYTRLFQYKENLISKMEASNSGTVEQFILSNHPGATNTSQAALINLNHYSKKVLHEPRYKKVGFEQPNIKGKRPLDFFDCVAAPCIDNCATHQNIPDYLYFTATNNFNKALQTILETNPMPSVTGNICDHLCQLRCTRVNYDDPLQIREIKRFVEENHTLEPPKTKPDNGIKVAIIGAGPSGLSAAYYLRLNGFLVNIFEEKERGGGMVSSVLPEFRLPDKKIDRDIARIEKMGVAVHYSSKVNGVLFKQLQKDNQYIYIATGAKLSAQLNIPGSQLKGVLDPLLFLEQVKLKKIDFNGKNVAIIGGGNTAMDTARVARRLCGDQGKVTIIYRRRIKDMPADLGEIKAVMNEDMEILEKLQPLEIVGDQNKVNGLKVGKVELIAQKAGRPKPQLIPGTEEVIPFDTIIPAVGQEVLIDFMNEDEFNPHPNSFELKTKNIFTGGDAMRGASTAIKAIADGRKIAETIIKRAGMEREPITKSQKGLSYLELMHLRARKKLAVKNGEHLLGQPLSFAPVSKTLDKGSAMEEAKRCLQCDLICNVCVSVCPNRANYGYRTQPRVFQLKKAVLKNNKVVIQPDKPFEVKQEHQIINIADYCNECGNCDTFCPTAEAPYKNKPKFYLSAKSFNEVSEGFLFSRLPGKDILIQKEQGGIRTIEKQSDKWVYETDHVKAHFSNDDFELEHAEFKVPCAQQAYFTVAAEMRVLYEAAQKLIPA